MPVDNKALWDAVKIVLEEEEGRKMAVYTFGASVATPIAACAGLLVLGPFGPLVGASLAGIGAYFVSRNKYKPLAQIIDEDLTPAKRNELMELLRKSFKQVDWQDVAKVSAIFACQNTLRGTLWTLVQDFLAKELMTNAVNNKTAKASSLPTPILSHLCLHVDETH